MTSCGGRASKDELPVILPPHRRIAVYAAFVCQHSLALEGRGVPPGDLLGARLLVAVPSVTPPVSG